MDLDPFEPVGINAQTMQFLDVFLLHCLLADSPPDTPQEIAALSRNQHLAAARGREPGLRLERGDGDVALRDWAAEILAECAPIADALDAAQGGCAHGLALASAGAALRDADALPSARVLSTMRRDFDSSYIRFVNAQSDRTRHTLLGQPFAAGLQARFAELARDSLDEQARIEAADVLPFETYRLNYLAPQRLNVETKGEAA